MQCGVPRRSTPSSEPSTARRALRLLRPNTASLRRHRGDHDERKKREMNVGKKRNSVSEGRERGQTCWQSTAAQLSTTSTAQHDNWTERRGRRLVDASAAPVGSASLPAHSQAITAAMVIMRRSIAVTVGALIGVSSTVAVAQATAPGPLYQLVDIAAQRLRTADAVAASKWVNGGSIEDGVRADQVLDAVGTDARTRGLDEERVRRMFEDQIHATEGLEYMRFGQWKFVPSDAPTRAPDLTQIRSEIDEFNHAMVAEMATQRDVLFGPDCAQALQLARDSVAAARALDPLYRQGLDAATASYCG
jgi:chorismate mutase